MKGVVQLANQNCNENNIMIKFKKKYKPYKPKLNVRKFRELILYICKKSRNDPNFGMEKLKMLLYSIDMQNYADTGKSMTGATYIREKDVENRL